MAILFSLWLWIIAATSIILFLGVKWVAYRQRVRQNAAIKPRGSDENPSFPEVMALTETDHELDNELDVKPLGNTRNLLDPEVQAQVKVSKKLPPEVLVLYVLAQQGSHFHGYELQQVLSNQDLQFGDMNIFHRYSADDISKPIFSVASATEPGTFDIDHMGTVSCLGLCLMMPFNEQPQDKAIFTEMFDTAQLLADELYAEVYDHQKNLMNDEILQGYHDLIDASLLKFHNAVHLQAN